MRNLYIDSWWGKYIGSSEDTLILLNYFRDADHNQFKLSVVLQELHLDELLDKNAFIEQQLYYCPSSQPNIRIYFDLATNVLLDLTTIILQTMIQQPLVLSSLTRNSQDQKPLYLKYTKSEIMSLKKAIDYFVNHVHNYEIANYLSGQELAHYITQSKQIRAALDRFY